MKDGGPAFPGIAKSQCSDGRQAEFAGPSGMSLRDYFAAAALQGVINTQMTIEGAAALKGAMESEGWDNPRLTIAAMSWALADAMIAERGK